MLDNIKETLLKPERERKDRAMLICVNFKNILTSTDGYVIIRSEYDIKLPNFERTISFIEIRGDEKDVQIINKVLRQGFNQYNIEIS